MHPISFKRRRFPPDVIRYAVWRPTCAAGDRRRRADGIWMRWSGAVSPTATCLHLAE